MKVNYVKLGEKANFFYDAVSGLKVLPGQVIKVDEEKAKANSKIGKALKSGHLEFADEEDYDPSKVANLLQEVGLSEKSESEEGYTQEELIDMALELGSSLSKSKLKKLSLEELNNHVNELNGNEEDEN